MEKQNKYINFLIYSISDGPSEKLEMEKGLFFVGKTIHIPFDKHYIETGEDSIKPGGMQELEIKAMKEMGMGIFESGFIPLGQAHQIERYETIDVSKCDVSILYRMPCRRMTPKEQVEYEVTNSAKVIPFRKKEPIGNAKLRQIEKITMNSTVGQSIVRFQEYAKSQGCPQEAVDKIPTMFAAAKAQAIITDYDGPTPEEVNPKFFE